MVFLTADQILDQYLGIQDPSSVLLMVDKKVVQDKSAMKVDKSFIGSVERIPLADANYLDESFQHMDIVLISLSYEGDKKQEIRIRGSSAPFSF